MLSLGLSESNIIPTFACGINRSIGRIMTFTSSVIFIKSRELRILSTSVSRVSNSLPLYFCLPTAPFRAFLKDWTILSQIPLIQLACGSVNSQRVEGQAFVVYFDVAVIDVALSLFNKSGIPLRATKRRSHRKVSSVVRSLVTSK